MNFFRSKEKLPPLDKNTVYGMLIKRICETYPDDSLEIDRISTAFSSAQGRRVEKASLHTELIGLSLIGYIEKYRPEIAGEITSAYENISKTLKQTYGNNPIIDILREPGSCEVGAKLSTMLSNAIIEKKYGQTRR